MSESCRVAPPPIGTRSKLIPSVRMDSTNSINAGVTITDTVSFVSVPKYMRRRPRPRVCSGRIWLSAVYSRNPTMTVTLRTSHPSLSIRTDTMALQGDFQESISLDCLRSRSSSSFFFPEAASEISPLFLVWMTNTPPCNSGQIFSRYAPTSSQLRVSSTMTNRTAFLPRG